MAVAMTGLAFNSVICTPHFCHENYQLRTNRNGPSIVYAPALAFSNFTCFSGRQGIEERHTRRGLNSKWRTGALARTPVEEGVADAKRVIDEVLRSRGGDGAGGIGEVSWALYPDEETKRLLEDAVAKLGACRGQDFGEFLRSSDSHGVWEVFYAPHIFRLTSAVRTQVRSLQNILRLRILEPCAVLQSAGRWLSAAGDYVVRDGKTVEILFDSFWADAGSHNLQPDPKGKGSIERTLVNLAGRGAFISALSVYPVYNADADVTVFEFTTLRTKISARKIR